jgi:hypothetical protein
MTDVTDEAVLNQLLPAALERLQADFNAAAPQLAASVMKWLAQLAGGQPPHVYFQHPLAFPSLLLPWWLEQSLRAPDLGFQADLVHSTINGYYYIRLVDNLMDGHSTVESQLLPAAGFFHAQFQQAYVRYFAASHPFWKFFTATWFRAAEVTWQDAVLSATLEDIDLAQFQQVAAHKADAGKIPLAAVCYHCGCPDRLPGWLAFFDRLGAWFQFSNDLFDWNKDLKYHTRTYFLAEAARRKRDTESIAQWVLHEGFEWGCALLHDWLAQVRAAAAPLNSPPLLAYLERREKLLAQQQAEVAAGLAEMQRLAAILATPSRGTSST